MFGSLTSTVASKAGALETKLILYIVLGIVAIVILNLLLDGVRKYIRGLDTAALGALFIWLGYKASEMALVNVLSNLLLLVGGTLVAVGLLSFILLKLFRHKRSVKRSGPPMPKHAQTDEKEKSGSDAEEKTAEAEGEAK